MLSVGRKIDLHFRVKAVVNGAPKEVEFADLLRRRTIVSVYMKDRTPSCDRQNESLSACADELARNGYDIVAVSRSTCPSHQRYAAAMKIPYPLVSDPEDHFARAADALVEKSMYGRRFIGPARSAFVLERDGTVLGVIEKVDSANHAAQLRELIRAL